jgi:hypothetical protein
MSKYREVIKQYIGIKGRFIDRTNSILFIIDSKVVESHSADTVGTIEEVEDDYVMFRFNYLGKDGVRIVPLSMLALHVPKGE